MKKTIMVVDDEQAVIKMLQIRLEKNNYNVVTAADGRECLERVVKERPDLIILDILMPEMDGTEAAAKLKENPLTRRIPVIFLTALEKKEEEKQFGTTTGSSVILAKPFDEQELITTIETMLQ